MNSWLLNGGPLSVLRETGTPNSANILSRRGMTDVVEMKSRMSTTLFVCDNEEVLSVLEVSKVSTDF